MAIKITRTLYVGLGGTGVKAILRTKQCFLDAYGEIPQMIGFLAIDTNLASKNESVLRVDGKEHVYLNNSEIVVCTDSAAFTKYHQLKSAYQWMPESNVDALKTITSDGAGQVRSNGRFICITNSNTISTALRHKIAELAAPLPQGYRFEYDVDTTTQVATQTVVNVVGSVAGGTGSGMFIDVLALLDTSVNQMGNANVEIRPWLVLPDIFRQQYPGPLSFNVFKNAYGALREFDNLMEHKATQAPINFHYAQLNGLQHATYAFVISNANSIQNLQKIDDITDSIGRSMFLPATQVGGAVDGIMSNVRSVIVTKQFNIPYGVTPNKQAWAVSAGSAELVYDSNAIAKSVGYQIIKNVCDSLCTLPSPNTAYNDAALWMCDPNVAIEEDQKNMLIDSLIPTTVGSSITFDEDNANSQYIDLAISNDIANCGVLSRYNAKLTSVKDQLDGYIKNGLNSNNGVANMRAFLQELVSRINECERQMREEIQNEFSQVKPDWDALLPAIKRSGISARLLGVIIQDEAEVLSNTISAYTTNLLEKTRREYALNFYAALLAKIAEEDRKLVNLQLAINEIAMSCSNEVTRLKQDSSKESCFRVNLHKVDLNFTRQNLSDVESFLTSYDVNSLIGKTKDQISVAFFTWVNSLSEISEIRKKSINDALNSMNSSEVELYLHELRKKAFPLWSYDSLGLEQTNRPKAEFSILGLENGYQNSIFDVNTPNGRQFSQIFSSFTIGHEYVTTHQKDRIVAMMMVASAPIYSVCNIDAYESEYNAGNTGGTVGYLDKSWDLRIKTEGTPLIPIIDTGIDPVAFWVKGLVLGLIHHDIEHNYYWVTSSEHGDELHQYMCRLGENREYAFSNFESLSIYKEIKDSIDDRMKKSGSDIIQKEFDKVSIQNYFEEYAQLSDIEKVNMDDINHYQDLRDILKREIQLVSKGLNI